MVNQKFSPCHFTGQTQAGKALFDTGFEIDEPIEFTGITRQLKGAPLKGNTEVGEDILGSEVEFFGEDVRLLGINDRGSEYD